LLLALDLGFIDPVRFTELADRVVEVKKMLTALLRRLGSGD